MLVNATLGNWIYVLLGLAWLAYSIHKGLQKKNTGATNSSRQKERKSSFFDAFLQEMTGEAEKVESQHEAFEDALDTTTTAQQSAMESVHADLPFEKSVLKKAEKEAPFEATKSVLSASFTESEKNVKKSEITRSIHRKKIDIRKAVIYSVILEPYSL